MGRSPVKNTAHISLSKQLIFTLSILIVLSSLIVLSPNSTSDVIVSPYLSSSTDVGLTWVPVTGGLPSGIEHYSVAFGDVNNDGKLDVVAQSSGMRAYVGNGLGNFVSQSAGLPNSGGPSKVVLADFNNDGNLDIAGVGVYFGNGGRGGSMLWTPTVSPGNWYALTVADVNLDGNADIIAGSAGNGVRVWTGDGGVGGSMVWTPSSVGLPVSGEYWGVDVGDFNHDGKPDIVIADRINGIKAWTGNGQTGPASLWTDAYTGTGLPLAGSYANVDLGDVNHDGNLDIVSTSLYANFGVRAWLGNGGVSGSMTWTENSSGLDRTTSRYLGVSIQDFNDDGDPDIVAAHYNGLGLQVWLGDGGAGGTMDWTDASSGLPNGLYTDVDTGDFNNDGKIDIVTGYNNGVEIWRNERPDFNIVGYTQISNGLPTSLTWADVVFEDVDHDGKLDIGFTRFQNGNEGLRVYRGDGTGNWVNSSNGLPFTRSYGGMRFFDINHDGAVDLVAAGNFNANDGVDVWRGDATGSWISLPGPTTFSGSGLEKGDLNNDGNVDIVTGYYSGNQGPMVFLSDGNFGWTVDVGPPLSTMNVDDVAIGDVNHDGRLDFAASSMNNIGIQLWTGFGTSFVPSWTRNDTGLPTTGVYLGLAFDDVDHDGNLDLAASGFGPTQGMYVFTGNGGAGGTMIWQNESFGLPMSGGYGGVELCDLNLDGNLDIVFAGEWSGATGIGVRMGNGGAGGPMVWSNPSFLGLPTTGEYWGVACGDVDNDGLLEIGATKNGGVEVWKAVFSFNFPPTVNVNNPVGGESWTGNTPHTISWTMSDDFTPTTSLVVYINYSYTTGGGPIAGPLTGLASPSNYPWTTPPINANDVVVNIDVIDENGTRGWDRSNQFEIDSIPPRVTSTVPPNGQNNVAINTNVEAQWSENMNRTATESSFTLCDNATWQSVLGSMNWVGNRFIFNPTSDLAGDSWYTANFTTQAKDDSDPGNNIVALYSWSFRTAPIPDVLPPSIMNVSALPSPQEVHFNVNITANVTDDFGVVLVTVNVSNPYGFLFNDTMIYDTVSQKYYLDRNFDEIGDHSFTVWAFDTSGNANSSSGQFTMVDTTKPTLESLTIAPASPDIFQIVNISAVVQDNYALSGVWIDIEGYGNSSMIYDSMSGRYYNLSSYSTQSQVNFTIWANDTSDNWNSTTSSFAVGDSTSPIITQVTAIPSPQEVFGNVNISARVTDNFALSNVVVNITWPDSSWTNQSMTVAPSDIFYLDSSYDQIGDFSFRIWAVDLAVNWASASGVFQIVDSTAPSLSHTPIGTWRVGVIINFTATATDNFLLSDVRLNYVDVGGSPNNVTLSPAGGDVYFYNLAAQTSLGNITYFFWAVDSSGNSVATSTYILQITAPRPNPPTNLVAVLEGSNSIRLQWNAPTQNEDGSPLTDLRGYRVYRMITSGGQRTLLNTVIIQDTFYVDQGLEEGRTYYYVVIAVNSLGLESIDSNEAFNTIPSGTSTDDIWIIIPIIIVIIIVLTVIFLLLLMKKKKREQEEEIEEQSTIIDESKSEEVK